MSMEISGAGARPPIEMKEVSQSTQQASNPPGNPASAAVPSRADTFNLTDRASQMQRLEAQVSSLPVVDTQRVQQVQHAIATNTLQSEPAQVAEKMLAFESGMTNLAAG